MIKTVDPTTFEESSVPVSVFYDQTINTYIVSGAFLGEEILHQVENNLSRGLLFTTLDNNDVSQIQVKKESVKLKVFYSELK